MWRMGILLSLLLTMPVSAGDPTLVYLTRHAEKLQDHPTDPGLSPAGEKRVEMLARFFRHIQFDGIFATQYKRTQATVEPLAAERELAVQVVPTTALDEQVRLLQEHMGKVYLVSGHSNTLPSLIRKLGGPPVIIEDQAYQFLFLLVLEDGKVTCQQFQLFMD